jgi:hypothetical protein
MTRPEDHSVEERVLRAMKHLLTRIIRETATPPGTRHVLSNDALEEIRDCLFLISTRERDLAEAAGRPMMDRPHYTDEPREPGPTVIPLDRTGIGHKKKKP